MKMNEQKLKRCLKKKAIDSSGKDNGRAIKTLVVLKNYIFPT